MSHTPGPWKARGRRIEQAEDGGLLATLTDRPFVNSGMFTVEQMQDNARLIAAAPELVEALERVCNQYESVRAAEGYPTAQSESTKDARTLLARIKGES